MHVAGQSVQRVGEWGIPLASSGYVAQFVLSARNTFTPNPHLMRVALSLIVCLLLSACLTEPKACVNQPSDPATEQFAASLGIDIASMQKTNIGDYRRYIDDRPVFRQFFCPGCGALVENEVARADDPVLRDIELDIR